MILRRAHIAALHDITMAALSFVVALYLRIGEGFTIPYPYVWQSTALFTAIAAGVFFSFRLYKGIWRYASVADLMQLAKAVTFSLLIFTATLFIFTRLEGFPRSAVVINWFVLMALLGGPRFVYRALKDKMLQPDFRKQQRGERIPVLLIGTDANAELFLRETNSHYGDSTYSVVGLADDNRKRLGGYIHNVKVYGDTKSLPAIVKTLQKEGNAPRRIVVSGTHSGPYMRRLLNEAEKLGLTLAKLPSLSELKEGIDKVEIRPIAIEDLLGRPARAPNMGRRAEFIGGKNVLVTGAGGTIGSELVRQIAALEPAKITLFELSEYNLYQIEKQLHDDFPNIACRGVIGNVRELNALDTIFAEEKPEVVFHAAALKHVPIVEENVIEGVLTNVIGTKNVADTCLKYRTEKMVLISTDKAVHPSSLMGVTKRMAEYYVQGLGSANARKKTDFITVRFGNVLGSSGSVIPLFQKQLAKGGPLTVTHPEMTRYFMTVPEAVELVLRASTLSSRENEEKSAIFVLDMGEPMRITDLAKQIIRLSGRYDVDIVYTGVREGEKLYEELFYEYETREKTVYDDVLVARAKHPDFEDVEKELEALLSLCASRNTSAVINILREMVPEYEKPSHLTIVPKHHESTAN